MIPYPTLKSAQLHIKVNDSYAYFREYIGLVVVSHEAGDNLHQRVNLFTAQVTYYTGLQFVSQALVRAVRAREIQLMMMASGELKTFRTVSMTKQYKLNLIKFSEVCECLNSY